MKVIHLDEINSTNDYVKKHISELENLTAVYADRQTDGRGRLTRKWVDSGDDNLFLSIVIKPDGVKHEFPYANFTQYLSYILCLVLEKEYDLKPQIKWPNDVLVNNRKISGILAEGLSKGGDFCGMALGIGVNLNTSSENIKLIDKPATSVFLETGCHVDKKLFLDKLLSEFCLMYDEFVCKGFVSFKDNYVQRLIFTDKEISVNVLGNIHKGVAEGVTDDGSLILREDNKTNIYYIGDIL